MGFKVDKMAQVAGKAAAAAAKSGWRYKLGKWAYETSFFPQIGLRYDDTLRETEEVKEALRRLPAKEADERIFRISRAIQLSANKTILPKAEWTKFEDDWRYLEPYILEVRKERKERSEWAQK